jgi:hypothetical protein
METTVSEGPTREPRSARPPIRPLGSASASDGEERTRTKLIRVAAREGGETSRTSPRMRFDVLQLVAWALGLCLVVAGLVGLARAGFDDLSLTEPLVEVGGQAATPLLAALWLLLGLLFLVAATGEVAERGLRIGGVLLGILGAVWLIEPAAFTPYLGIDRESGVVALGMGVALTAASYIPPLSIARPGIPQD